MSDLLSNFFSHLKNAQQSRILLIEHPQSKIIMSVLNILQECGYIRGYRILVVPIYKDNYGLPSHYNKTSLQGSNMTLTLGQTSSDLKETKGLGVTNFFSKIEILLKYKNQKPAINNIIRVSKPSKRVYLSVKKLSHMLTKKTYKKNEDEDLEYGAVIPLNSKSLPNIAQGHEVNSEAHLSSLHFMKGILILSTSKGIMTHLTAYRLHIGGEVLCHIS